MTERNVAVSEEAGMSPKGPPGVMRKVLFPVVLAVLAAAIVANSAGLGVWVRLGPGPGFFPLVLGALLGVLSLMWIVQELRTGRGKKTGLPQEEALPDPDMYAELSSDEQPLRLRQAGAIVLSLVVLAALMPLIGFQLSMLFFLVFHLRILGRRRWPLTLLVSVIGSFGVFILFARVLTVNLPAASIGFLQVLGF